MWAVLFCELVWPQCFCTLKSFNKYSHKPMQLDEEAHIWDNAVWSEFLFSYENDKIRSVSQAYILKTILSVTVLGIFQTSMTSQ